MNGGAEFRHRRPGGEWRGNRVFRTHPSRHGIEGVEYSEVVNQAPLYAISDESRYFGYATATALRLHHERAKAAHIIWIAVVKQQLRHSTDEVECR
jgi:hypothetical protein